MIQQNLEQVRQTIQDACKRAGRDDKEVTLISVSKTKPLSMLREAYEAGARDFGENKVQELMEKIPEMPGDVRWHMIGHLQRNKVKYIVGKVFLIHSVDSLRLAEEISREAVKQGTEVDILLEVNVAEEESKFGATLEEAAELAVSAAKLPGIHIRGLMTIAPFVENAEENRQYFRKLKQLSVDIAQKNIDNVNMNVLSMGMTGDYPVAVEEGATYVRVGTGIFGERDHRKGMVTE
ncbi:MAG: YggS family pyridoxal phosphate-dependent enzyme [Lachnospiraceae bacterium]|nr:YggS family pyridoxal phosphate-dependent enzyme [Butyrivibrio sp.]MCM1345076.1 YggS family pyridoxal phosphate-dependent enzyme [Muribaculaceae bacterium]MCM1409662.1 YggS family pyridoxal phosphate-dependent enzyme [Lachnospiraceae bacterium]